MALFDTLLLHSVIKTYTIELTIIVYKKKTMHANATLTHSLSYKLRLRLYDRCVRDRYS